jgi:hypothetical protein
LFSRFVFHITGVALVLMLMFHVIPLKPSLSSDTGEKTNYSTLLRGGCMNDIAINLGMIGTDIIALCDDAEAHYAFHAQVEGQRYETKMASTHGVISTSTYPKDIGIRQMVMQAMLNHMDVVAELESAESDMLPTLQ